MARPVRLIESGRHYLLTNRCLLGMCLLRPDEETNRIIEGCLARAADKYDVDLVCYVFMSNHFHLIAKFPKMNMAEFMEEFQGQLASRINNHRDRSGPVFPYRYDDQALLDHQVIRDKICYVLNNPVKDGLVERPDQWPGVTSMDCHRDGDRLEGQWLNHRTWHNLQRRKDDYPRRAAMEEFEVELQLPEALERDDESERRQSLLELVESDRRRLWAKETGDEDTAPSVLGPEAIETTEWEQQFDLPESVLASPRLGVASSPKLMSDYEDRRYEVNDDYGEAVSAWQRREVEEFPQGTYPPAWRHCVGSPAAG